MAKFGQESMVYIGALMRYCALASQNGTPKQRSHIGAIIEDCYNKCKKNFEDINPLIMEEMKKQRLEKMKND